MGILDFIKHQFIEVIEWTESDEDTLAWHFPVADNEIKNGASLTVRPTQSALFVDQGKVADQFGAGRHELTTENLPLLTALRNWSRGFNSPFLADVFFFSLRQKLARRWGTPAPITIRDREFGSVQIRMFGTFSYHLADVAAFFREVCGTRDVYSATELEKQLVSQVSGSIAAVFAASGVPFLDMAANQQELAAAMQHKLAEYTARIGVAVDNFVVESVSLPPALQQALDERQAVGILGGQVQQLAAVNAARAIADAAKNPGPAGMGVGMAVGAGIAGAVGGAMGPQTVVGWGAPGRTATPPPAAATSACVACGKAIDAGAAFCRYCGKPQAAPQAVTCGKCGAVQAGDGAFCEKCGNPLGA